MICATSIARRHDSHALRIFPLLPNITDCNVKHSNPSIQVTRESSEQTRVATVEIAFCIRRAGVHGSLSLSISTSGGSCWRQEAIHKTALPIKAGWLSQRVSTGTGSNFGSMSSNHALRISHQLVLASDIISNVSAGGIRAINSWRSCCQSGLIELYAVELGTSVSGF